MNTSKFRSSLCVSKLIILLVFCQAHGIAQGDVESDEITFITTDSIKVYGDLYSTNMIAPTIILFHQAGSNGRGEYDRIIPQLLKLEFNVLVLDQRVGGQLFGSWNRTVAHIPDNEFEYCDAYPDLVGALNYIIEKGFSGQKFVWGSSYSASLAIRLASEYGDKINGVLAFSPASGGPMQACRPDEYFEVLNSPLLLLRPAKEMEIESVSMQYELAKQNGAETYISEYGVHGSSMLDALRTGHDTKGTWQAVKTFLNGIK
jgi:pimeloyl-ACP methyl ester carboxylesterase